MSIIIDAHKEIAIENLRQNRDEIAWKIYRARKATKKGVFIQHKMLEEWKKAMDHILILNGIGEK